MVGTLPFRFAPFLHAVNGELGEVQVGVVACANDLSGSASCEGVAY